MQDLLLLLNGRNKSIPAAARFSFNQSHYSVNGAMQTFGDLFTTTRATAAWDIADGELIEYAANEPVVNSNGLAVFEASTNLLTDNDGALATYPTRGGDVQDGTSFITGFSNAIEFIDSPTVSAFAYKNSSYTAATDYTLSFYIKMNDGGLPIVGTSSTDPAIDFIINMFGTFQPADSTEDLGGGIYRISSTENSAASTNQFFGVVKYVNNSSRGFTVLGYQLEEAGFASPIIITEGTAVTRNADVIVNNAAIAPWYNQSEGTIYMRMGTKTAAGVSASNFGSEFSDGTTSNLIRSYYDRAAPSARPVSVLTAGGAFQGSVVATGDEYLEDMMFAQAYKLNDRELAINGSSVGTDLTAVMPTGINQLILGTELTGALPLNGYIQDFRYYNTRLPQSQLEAITS